MLFWARSMDVTCLVCCNLESPKVFQCDIIFSSIIRVKFLGAAEFLQSFPFKDFKRFYNFLRPQFLRINFDLSALFINFCSGHSPQIYWNCPRQRETSWVCWVDEHHTDQHRGCLPSGHPISQRGSYQHCRPPCS